MGNMAPRPRKTPLLNMEAKTLTEMIDWGKESIHEPVFTCKLSQAEIKNFIKNPMDVPYYPLHTQSTERAVKQVFVLFRIYNKKSLKIFIKVTEAAAAVCGPEKRDGYVRARVANREVIPKFQSKKDLGPMLKN